MRLYQLSLIWEAIQIVLSYPLDIVGTILTNISREYLYMARVISGGGKISLGLIWDVLKWGLLFVLILGAALFVCIGTIRRVLSSERQKRNYFFDAVIIVLTLFVYYALLSIGLYVFSNVIVPIYLEL
ncbi:MAG: hypothetical protein ABIH22_03720 [Candidatus Margulisiibacteriota bacterium]